MTVLPPSDTADPGPPVAPEAAGGLARSSFGLLAANVVGSAGFFVAALVLARSLGPAGRGVMAFFIVTALVGSRLASLGQSDATAVAAARHADRRAAVFGNAVCFGVLFGAAGGAVVFALGAAVRRRLPEGIDLGVLGLLAAGVLLTTVSALAGGYLRGAGRFRAYALVYGLAPWLYAAVLIALWAGPGVDVHRAEVAWDVYALAGAGALLLAGLRVAGVARPARDLAREAVGFGVRAWVGSLAAILNARVDQILMGFITTEAVLGVYSVAVNVAEVLLYLPNAVGTTLLPAIARGAPELLLPRTLDAMRRLALVTVVSIAVAAAVGVPCIPLVFGSAFGPSRVPFLLLLPGALGYSVLVVTETALLAAGAPQLASLESLVALVVGVALDVALVPPLGADGASAAATAAFLASGAAGLVLLRRRSPFPWRGALPRWDDAATLARSARSVALRPLASLRA